jgi:hypothetical protein
MKSDIIFFNLSGLLAVANDCKDNGDHAISQQPSLCVQLPKKCCKRRVYESDIFGTAA